MNREIKFRAWHKIDKVMAKVISFSSDLVQVQYADDELYNSLWKREDCELLQFTGLEDKEGEEIYEGEIVRVTDRTSRREPFIAEVYYDLNVASFSGKVKNYPVDLFLHNPIKKEDWIPEMQPFMEYTRTIEIIGNIFQHPSLLK